MSTTTDLIAACYAALKAQQLKNQKKLEELARAEEQQKKEEAEAAQLVEEQRQKEEVEAKWLEEEARWKEAEAAGGVPVVALQCPPEF